MDPSGPPSFELEAVHRVVEAQADPARRALFALLYGTGREVSVALKLTRADVDPTTRRVRAAGTKAHTRPESPGFPLGVAYFFWAYAKDHLPTARLWRHGLTRFTVSDWHRATVKALNLPRYPLKNARHHWAVRMLRGGAPVHIVQAQLGHSTAKLLVRTAGGCREVTIGRGRRHRLRGPRPLTSNHTSSGVVARQVVT